jgi:hypothetical protein
MLPRMRVRGRQLALVVALAFPAHAGSAVGANQAGATAAASDRLSREIASWKAFLAEAKGTGPLWDDVRKSGSPVLARAEQALSDGRQLLAIQRLAAARELLAAARYVFSRSGAERSDAAAFEAEWRRVGEQLGPELGKPAADSLADVGPAALRAIGEAALPQVRVYYEASLDYGRSTVFDSGLFYMGSALAQRELRGLVRELAQEGRARQPSLRSLEPELRALESEILAAYKPPASIDRHVDFIRASAAVKEARELDALGLRHGALLRYLQAVMRFAPVKAAAVPPATAEPPPSPGHAPAPADAELGHRLAAAEARLRSQEIDHTIGQLFLETAQALAAPGEGADPAAARTIAEAVLPRYFAALEPAPPLAPVPQPRATVTLVRWPYT